LKVWGSNPSVGEIFHTLSDQPQGSPNLLYNGYPCSLPGAKWSRCGAPI